ncbi:hypothetical protein ATANTOWER_026020 [Ataeniobius toweri]|uniref:Uncharacterized protein n=1 Tax=Ataeniobius toweri TaxID=208326 RepID=A0ABU7A082_9TELE|nr:hypothetical protein [Ataeniobius toweri]
MKAIVEISKMCLRASATSQDKTATDRRCVNRQAGLKPAEERLTSRMTLKQQGSATEEQNTSTFWSLPFECLMRAEELHRDMKAFCVGCWSVWDKSTKGPHATQEKEKRRRELGGS